MLTPANVRQSLYASRSAGVFPFMGINFDQLAWGIANGFTTWGVGKPANLALAGAATGTAGTGQVLPVSSTVFVPANVPLMRAALSGSGVNGVLADSLAVVVTMGVVDAVLVSGQYFGVSPNVGVGSDVSKVVVSNGPSLATILQSTLSAAFGGQGPALPMLATGLGMGIAGLLLAGTGTGAVVGTLSSIPAAGLTTSVVV